MTYERRARRPFSTFATWIRERVEQMDTDGANPGLDLVNMSKPPASLVRHYKSMSSFGNHFRVDNEVGRSHVTFDSGVAAIITQVCRSSRQDQHPVEAELDYVGIVKDIFQVQYGHIPYNVLRCSWIRPNLTGAPTIKKDAHGFWSVKYNARQVPCSEPYLLSCHAKQVRQCPSQLPLYMIFRPPS